MVDGAGPNQYREYSRYREYVCLISKVRVRLRMKPVVVGRRGAAFVCVGIASRLKNERRPNQRRPLTHYVPQSFTYLYSSSTVDGSQHDQIFETAGAR